MRFQKYLQNDMSPFAIPIIDLDTQTIPSALMQKAIHRRPFIFCQVFDFENQVLIQDQSDRPHFR